MSNIVPSAAAGSHRWPFSIIYLSSSNSYSFSLHFRFQCKECGRRLWIQDFRGRLLSERVASKAANVEAANLGNKLMELEDKLKEEVKGRDRAQKRLTSLMNKLQSFNIAYAVSDESSSHSTSFGISESSVSSSSSTTSSFTYPSRKPELSEKKKCELEEPVIKNGSTEAKLFNHTDVIDNASTENQSLLPNEKISCDKTISDKSFDELRCTQFSNYTKHDDHRPKYSVQNRETDGESHEDWDETSVDNSMALVPVNIPATTQTTSTTIEPLIPDNATAEDVLHALKFLKEKLRSSMERSRMIRVGL